MGRPLRRMSNVHAPTVPSGSTTVRTTNGTAAQLSIIELHERKSNIEAELKALGGVLDSHGVDMNTPLVTADGFPRADIDVVQIRTTRARIIHLKNDYKDLMALVEKRIHEHFASLDESDEDTRAAAIANIPQDPVPQVLPQPFAKVNSVVEGSPADQAGLRSGDEIRVFGYVNASNHERLRKVGECVQGNEGQNILVKISRPLAVGEGREEVELTLIPRRNWGGRGMLGCHILPI